MRENRLVGRSSIHVRRHVGNRAPRQGLSRKEAALRGVAASDEAHSSGQRLLEFVIATVPTSCTLLRPAVVQALVPERVTGT